MLEKMDKHINEVLPKETENKSSAIEVLVAERSKAAQLFGEDNAVVIAYDKQINEALASQTQEQAEEESSSSSSIAQNIRRAFID